MNPNEMIIANKPLGVYAWHIIQNSNSNDFFIIFAIDKHLPEAESLIKKMYYLGFEEIWLREKVAVKGKNRQLLVNRIRIDKIPALKSLRG